MSVAAPAVPVEKPAILRGMAEVLQPFVNNGTMAGAVTLAATLDRILNAEAVGFADIAGHKPMATDHLFWIASMTKPMTATALMMLVDEGLVNVADPVEKYLPEFKGQKVVAAKGDDLVVLKTPQHPITVREILSHTSGLLFTVPIETPTLDRLSLEHAVRSYAMSSLQFEPGRKYEYSNAGTNTAGRIIEVVSGMSYEDFMDQRLFGPLDMKDTTFWPNEEQLGRLAKIYKTNAAKTGLEEATISQLSYPLNNARRKPMPAGGLFSTASDILEFCRMILSGGEYKGRRYLSENAIRQMTSKQTGPAVEKEYGFCWDTAGDTFDHGGAYKTNMTIHPKLGLITVFLVHQAGDWPAPKGDTIFPLFMAKAEQLARAGV